MQALLHSMLPTLTDPHIHLRLLDTHGQVWVSLLWGHCSFFLGPSVHKVLFAPSKSLFPQSCLSSGTSMVGLMATSSKRAYAVPRSTAPRAPVPAAVHCWPVPPQETLKHSSGRVSVGSLGPGVHKVCFSLWESLVAMGFDSEHNFTPPTILLVGLLLCPRMWGIFFWWRVVQDRVVILEALQEKMRTHLSTLPSWNATLNNYDNFFYDNCFKIYFR